MKPKPEKLPTKIELREMNRRANKILARRNPTLKFNHYIKRAQILET